MNFIIYPFKICPECYSDNLTTDYEKAEVICSDCGLIVQDTTSTTIKQREQFYKREKEVLKELKQYPQLKLHIEHYEKIEKIIKIS